LREEIRGYSSEIETGRRLPAPVVDLLTATGIFRAGVPLRLGGPEIDLVSQIEAFEELGRTEGSVGWCAMIGAQTSWTAGQLPEDEARTIFGSPTSRAAGVFAPNGRATATAEGFTLSGRWPFASGVTHCDWIALGAIVFDSDDVRMDGDRPDARFLFLPVSDVEIEDTWDVSGLRGTGSNHVTVRDVAVPASRTFPLLASRPVQPGPLYRLPLLSALALGVASVALGVARDALDALDALAAGKTPTGGRRTLAQRGQVQVERASAEAELRAARILLYDAVHTLWNITVAGDELSIEQRASVRLAATNAVRSSARVVDRTYEAGGGTSIYASSRLQRDFRDVHAITQHIATGPATLELVGRVLLGVETDLSQL
jgi:alkylation response protein AidB-like acyl-CoA dehydrogenase